MNQPKPSDQELFESVRKLKSLDEKYAYLDRVCGHDPIQMKRVFDLVLADHESGSFLETLPPGLEQLTCDEFEPTIQELQIGPYKLIKKLGEGGMGIVYLAEQSEPVRRRVALKIIKPGMDSRYVLSRFESERQSLSIMDHPNIAKIFEAGATTDGRPYFAMEWIQGESITKFCEQTSLSPQDRIELFLQVCFAVHHAHQKGIIHRDLKPSNILVSLVDGHPTPKVIDFGLAKALSSTSEAVSQFTSHGQIVGTIEYMSPEQAAGDPACIDTRSDLYSLGVILYEILAGVPPFDKKRLREAGWREVVRIVQEETPPRPSLRLSSVEAELSADSSARRSQTQRISQILRGDLDWIVMKAIEKTSSRRYASVLHLADDLNRFLRSETVLASPPSIIDAIRKFGKRHRAAIFFLSLLAISLVGGVIGTTFGMIRAMRSQDRADKAMQEAIAQQKIADHSADIAAQAASESEQARILERAQRERADAAVRGLSLSLEESKRLVYANQLMAARSESDGGNRALAEEILKQTDPKKRGWEYNFVYSSLHKNRFDLEAGYGEILSVAESKEHGLVAAGCEDRTVRVWNSQTKVLIARLEGHSSTVTSVRFIPGPEKKLISGDKNGNVYLWDLNGNLQPAKVSDSKLGVVAIEVIGHGEQAIIAYSVGTVDVVQLDGGYNRRSLSQEYPGLAISDIAVSGQHHWVAVIGAEDIVQESCVVHLQNWETGEIQRTIELDDWKGTNVEFSPDGQILACGSRSQFRFSNARGIRLYDTESGKAVSDLTGNLNHIGCIAFSRDGSRIYGGGSMDGTVSVWDVASKQLVSKLPFPTGICSSLVTDEEGKHLIGGGFSQVHVWNLEADPFRSQLEGEQEAVRNAVIDSDTGQVLASVGDIHIIPGNDGSLTPIDDGEIVLWDTQRNQKRALASRISPVCSIAQSPSGKLSATRLLGGTIQIWDLQAGESKGKFEFAGGFSEPRVAFVGENALLVNTKEHLKRIDRFTGETLQTYPMVGHPLSIAVNKDGGRAAVHYGQTTHVIDLNTSQVLVEKRYESWRVGDVMLNRKGSRLIFVDNFSKVDCVDVATGAVHWSSEIGGCTLGGFADDETRLILGSGMNLLILDAATGFQWLSIPMHEDMILSARLSPDEKNLVTVGADNKVLVHRLMRTGE